MSLENTQAQVDDQALQFKKRARRRLVGAIALVLIMVAVLPMVLDDRAAKQPQQEIAISIPSQESTDFSSKVVPVAPANPSPNSEPIATPPNTSPEKSITSQTQTTPPPVEPSPAALPQVEKKPTAKEQAINKPMESNATKTNDEKIAEKQSDTKPDTKIAPKKEAAEKSKDTSNKEKPKSDKTAEKASTKNADASKAKETADTSHKIVVQIGVFSDANNVKQMQQKLSQAGIKAYTEQLSTDKGEKTRLRAGPYASRQEAESALEKVKSLGMPGMVISK